MLFKTDIEPFNITVTVLKCTGFRKVPILCDFSPIGIFPGREERYLS